MWLYFLLRLYGYFLSLTLYIYGCLIKICVYISNEETDEESQEESDDESPKEIEELPAERRSKFKHDKGITLLNCVY